MNKRAFTLIELLAIMTLLGIMVVLVLPQISGSIESRKATQYNNIVDTIKNAAKVYYSDNDQTSMVSVATLVQNDYLSSGLTNPVTGDLINGCILIEKDSDGYNVYNYYDNCSDVHEYTMNNLITNGSFENGTTNWNYSPSITVSNNQKKYGSYSARNLNGGQWWGISKGYYDSQTNLISVTSGHIYYALNWIYLANVGTGYCYSDLTLIYNSTNNWFANLGNSGGLFNSWKKLSNRVTIPNVTNPKLTMTTAAYNQTDNIIDCYADGALLIDLTAVFGAGNEPTKEWCDNNINYFDGSKTIYAGTNTTDKITLTVDPNGGTYEGSTSNTTYQISVEGFKTINDPTRAGYTFDGWTITGEGTYSNWLFHSGTTDATLTAKWNLVVANTLVVNANGGTWGGTTPQNLFPNSTTIIVNPVRAGYAFSGWTVSGTGSSINGTTFTMGTANTTLTANWLSYSSMYTYTGSSTVVDDGSGNWRIKFLTSGTFTPLVSMDIDIFVVGGGGGGGVGSNSYQRGGGGGGYTGTWMGIHLESSQPYSVVVGAGGAAGGSGGVSSFNSTYSKNGGAAGGLSTGGAGGSGGGGSVGAGGSNGSNGVNGGSGQGTTTREFGEITGALYAGGGGGGAWDSVGGAGGAGGGGFGGGPTTTSPTQGTVNTGGGGGGGADMPAAAGGSGIVVIRNAQLKQVGNSVKYKFTYTGSVEIVDGNTDNWKLKFLSSGTFTIVNSMRVDAFLVGGGGGGGVGSNSYQRGGGGGGYTGTWTDIDLTAGQSYPIVVGNGGSAGASGGTTSVFGYSKAGGAAGGLSTGGAGGSGGGGSRGDGGSDGSNGVNGGSGQGTTTREFGEITGALYAGGGGGGAWDFVGGSGGAGGGGFGGGPRSTSPTEGMSNTGGGGGGGADMPAAAGGSGIVMIRPS